MNNNPSSFPTTSKYLFFKNQKFNKKIMLIDVLMLIIILLKYNKAFIFLFSL